MATATVNAGSDLLFAWGPRRRRKLSIASFVLASFALHAFGFYLFQIVYPPSVAPLVPASRVSVISPSTPDGRQLLRWIEAEDPAITSATQRAPEAKTYQPPRVPHAPTYLGHLPSLRPIAPFAPDLRVPSAHPPGPVSSPRTRQPSVTRPTPTSFIFSQDLTDLGPAEFPATHFARIGRDAPDAALFRVSVNSQGEIRNAILARSSGDSALDEQARQALALVRFSQIDRRKFSAPDAIIWGTATVQWGNDVAPPADSRPSR